MQSKVQMVSQELYLILRDSDGFRANISTNEPGTESQNPSFIVLQSSQLPAAEISRQLQTEADLASAQQEEQPLEEQAELPAKTIAAPRKTQQPAKQSRRPLPAAPLPIQQQPQQVSVPVKSKRPSQQAQQAVAQPAKRTAPSSKGASSAIRSRGPSKGIATAPSTTTTQRPKPISAPSKRPIQIQQQQQPQEEEPAQLSQSQDQGEESAEDDSQEQGF